MRVNWRTDWPQWVIIGGMLSFAALAWPSTPDQMPVHWNLYGEPDRFGGKFEGLFVVPLAGIAVYLVLAFAPRFDPGRANYAQFAQAVMILRTAVIAMLGAVYIGLQLAAHGSRIDISKLVALVIGGLFLVSGSVMGKLRPNWFFGIRTPWTLSSKEAWVKTHRLGGWLFVAGGFLIMLSSVAPAPWNGLAIAVVAFSVGIVTVVYSYFVWRSDPEKIPPAGTRPA